MYLVNINNFHAWFESQGFTTVIAVDWEVDINGLEEANIVRVLEHPGTYEQVELDLDTFLSGFLEQ